MKMWLGTLTLAVAVLGVGLVRAQDPEDGKKQGEKDGTEQQEKARKDGPTEEPGESAEAGKEPAKDPYREKVLRLLEVQGDGVTLRDQFVKGMKMGLPGVPEDFFDGMIEEKEFVELEDLVVAIYRKHWAEDEIEELLAFYETPLGKKVASKQNIIMQETFEATQVWGMKIVPRLTAKLMEQEGGMFGLDEEEEGEDEDDDDEWGLDDPDISDELAALRGLRHLSAIQARFREGDRDNDNILDYAGSLDELAEAGLLDENLKTGKLRGYSFGISGATFDWQASASPAEGGDEKRNFIICTDGILRFSQGAGPATCLSAALR